MFQHKFGARALMREGGKFLGAADNPTLRNIEAIQQISDMLKTSLGPNSMKKLIVNHIDKKFVTSDCNTILAELEVVHPVGKIVLSSVESQKLQFGDGSNTLVALLGELLTNAGELLQDGVHISDIRKGYEIAFNKLMEHLPSLVCYNIKDLRDHESLRRVLYTAMNSKFSYMSEFLSKLVTDAVISVMPTDVSMFDPENIRVVKLTGGSLMESNLVNGLVLIREPLGSVKKAYNCRVLVLSVGLEFSGPETKGTVLLKTAEQLLNYTKGEEREMETVIKSISDKGVGVIVCNGAVSEMALHFCNKYNILVLKLVSKFDLRRVCRTTRSQAVMNLSQLLPQPADLQNGETPEVNEEFGYVESMELTEISSKKCVIIRAKDSRVNTIILKGATNNQLDEVERGIDDAVALVDNLKVDGKFLPGAGAVELQLSVLLKKFSDTVSGLERYAVEAFAKSLQVVPKILATNAGVDCETLLTNLLSLHENGKIHSCVDIETGSCGDSVELKVFDHYQTKHNLLTLCYEALMTILTVDQIIVAKPAGGPKPPGQNNPDF
ncbi:chaperonin (T-complex protein 1 (TCP1), theta subunit) [Theileria annulata]|uniref:CCT-theta n=1 Tax=Theileria annulata TaxID=5874 RepID=Q4UIV8_THEAN|nr:chaperonin (T-complex protein 1 (TCP1), theta subunit) [Theileria annulata]CAI72981.1 chaperonin (T-complex protein 1 (TCP1), theta subunit homologue), putative [Theileria annulata]|eukprot:XP_953659.1 chaperonin (T-complex protein 1 (TCP1), theta subunit homologue), putative [Theileria annulata]